MHFLRGGEIYDGGNQRRQSSLFVCFHGGRSFVLWAFIHVRVRPSRRDHVTMVKSTSVCIPLISLFTDRPFGKVILTFLPIPIRREIAKEFRPRVITSWRRHLVRAESGTFAWLTSDVSRSVTSMPRCYIKYFRVEVTRPDDSRQQRRPETPSNDLCHPPSTMVSLNALEASWANSTRTRQSPTTEMTPKYRKRRRKLAKQRRIGNSLPLHHAMAAVLVGLLLSSSAVLSIDDVDDEHAEHEAIRKAQSMRKPPPQRTTSDDFMDWCKQALGITTILEIQTFDYYNYMAVMPEEDWNDDDAEAMPPVDSVPMMAVRGLAASRDIAEGEVVIRIPLHALLSVTTTIDKDPVLGPVMGPDARQRHGWMAGGSSSDSEDTEPPASLTEIPLLAVALLHHRRLGTASPLVPYLRILQSTPVDSMPYLWSKERLKSDVSEGVRTVARGIKREMRDMYEDVMEVLIAAHPDLFGAPENGSEWMFSYDNFGWAFAMVNSRHWQLPIVDMEDRPPSRQHHQQQDPEDDGQVPPASTPTDAWLREHATDTEPTIPVSISPHSFLAPVADLLNFGPPCTRGSYNADLHVFEMIATCAFRQGQEVTFWYSDECDHWMAAVYGFTHPLVPPCPSAEDYRRRAEDWQARAEDHARQLKQSQAEVDYLEGELVWLQDILDGCDCCKYDAPHLRHEHVRGAAAKDDLVRHGRVRQMRRAQNSEF